VNRAEAAGILGVDPDAPREETRAAFRALIRAHHPDRVGGGAAATADSTRLIEAYRLLRSTPPDPPPAATPAPGPPPPTRRSGTPVDARVDGDSILVAADPTTVMVALVEAGHALGEITYLDRSSGLVEVMLQVQEEGDARPAACSLVATLQGRLDAVEVFFTVERLDGHPAPPVAPIVAAVAAEMGAPRL